ncbi:hypothetical protein GCM10027176_64940 [Actinoallomurus bryophytorum]
MWRHASHTRTHAAPDATAQADKPRNRPPEAVCIVSARRQAGLMHMAHIRVSGSRMGRQLIYAATAGRGTVPVGAGVRAGRGSRADMTVL